MTRKGERDISDTVSLFLCGDVMLGRGIDQILPHPCDPELFEPSVKSAEDYVRLAERKSGPIPAPVGFDYVWGNALSDLDRRRPDVRLINLETAITASGTAVPKGINYRMHPENTGVLTKAGIDACVLANNHVLDWGLQGLLDSLQTLEGSGIGTVGAGRDLKAASEPLIIEISAQRRVIVFAFGSTDSGIPESWAAAESRPGVNLLPDSIDATVRECREAFRAVRQRGDIALVSIHWGGNWGYDVPPGQRTLAHRLIDEADIDIVHGHSSHHPKPVEVYRNRLILYGCGDLINDYEGIRGYERFRDDLTLAYFARISTADGHLVSLEMVPYRIRKMRLERTGPADAGWLAETLNREARAGNALIEVGPGATLELAWECDD